VKHSATCSYSLHSTVRSFSDDYCQFSYSQLHGNLLLSLICGTTLLLRSPLTLQVHLAISRAVSAFTAVLTNSTGTVNTFSLPKFSYPTLSLSHSPTVLSSSDTTCMETDSISLDTNITCSETDGTCSCVKIPQQLNL
uniref:Uncharacterized protein n=1 Tax=Amphimedon queenslandica TaxID=400682 RepID=A0A1X7UDH4_AMPQE